SGPNWHHAQLLCPRKVRIFSSALPSHNWMSHGFCQSSSPTGVANILPSGEKIAERIRLPGCVLRLSTRAVATSQSRISHVLSSLTTPAKVLPSGDNETLAHSEKSANWRIFSPDVTSRIEMVPCVPSEIISRPSRVKPRTDTGDGCGDSVFFPLL